MKKDLLHQYLNSTVIDLDLGQSPLLPNFLTKIIEKYRSDVKSARDLARFDSISLFKEICESYGVVHDFQLAFYFNSLLIRNGTEILTL